MIAPARIVTGWHGRMHKGAAAEMRESRRREAYWRLRSHDHNKPAGRCIICGTRRPG